MCKVSKKFNVAFDTCKPPVLRCSHIFLIINHIWSSVMNMPSQNVWKFIHVFYRISALNSPALGSLPKKESQTAQPWKRESKFRGCLVASLSYCHALLFFLTCFHVSQVLLLQLFIFHWFLFLHNRGNIPVVSAYFLFLFFQGSRSIAILPV